MMRIRLTLAPGQKGTKRLVAEYGDRLVCVRYRYDEVRQKRYKTVELIIEETDWNSATAAPERDPIVGVRVAWGELALARQIKRAGGVWNGHRKVWELPYAQVVAMKLEQRVVAET